MIPAPGLHTAHRHTQLLLCGHEHRHVERAVLLGADHLFALIEEDGDLGPVLHDEVVDGGSALVLAEPYPALAALCEGDELLAWLGPEQGEYGEWSDHVGIADAERIAQMDVDGWSV